MLRCIGFCTVFALLALPACQFDETGVDPLGGGDDPDITDPGVVPPPGGDTTCWGWSMSFFDPCDIEPGGGITIGDGVHTYDTDSGVLRAPDNTTTTPASALLAQPAGPSTRILTINSLTVTEAGTLRVVGSRPLLIASWTRIDVLGTIDASSRYGENDVGAGSEPFMCIESAPTRGQNREDGPGGGGGGAFAGKGGNGGDGKAGTKGSGGTNVAFPGYIRGGCAGAKGGDDQLEGGTGSAGGGAVQLVARYEIYVNGMVEAGGAGGGPGLQGDDDDGRGTGGGGAGSGGYVGLEAPTITLADNAVLAANGGGGGEGGDRDATGEFGENGLLAMLQAEGGAGAAPKGGNGGDGGFTDKPDGKNGQKSDVGGGGGGGAGFVALRADTLSVPVATVSPDPTLLPW